MSTKEIGNVQKDPEHWVSGDDPMTEAQASYLHTLSEEAHQPIQLKGLTKAEASKLIDQLRKKAGIDSAGRDLAQAEGGVEGPVSGPDQISKDD